MHAIHGNGVIYSKCSSNNTGHDTIRLYDVLYEPLVWLHQHMLCIAQLAIPGEEI